MEEGGTKVEEDDKGLEMVVEVDHEVEDGVVHRVVGVVQVDDDDDEVVVVAEDKIQDVEEAAVDRICEVAVADVGPVVEVDVYEKAYFFLGTLVAKKGWS